MKKVTFDKNEEGVKLMAIYVSQLTREGMEYQIESTVNKFTVIITGF
jgi:hypothetical protein